MVGEAREVGDGSGVLVREMGTSARTTFWKSVAGFNTRTDLYGFAEKTTFGGGINVVGTDSRARDNIAAGAES